ncbi:MAG TPA: ferritin-like protein [Thermoanaerobaculia bacterium]|jgi:hypothetical protein|nr:ferritin-like protein [Thermoanaerobaculia bacterium]
MLKVERRYIAAIQAARKPEDLHWLVQSAIELEHSTIPPYLAAYFSLKLGTNDMVADILRSVAMEEMLHMSIASNLMIAIGGSPQINRPGFVPKYPGPLPMNIGDGLIVPIGKCSVELVKNVFMVIEEPENPIDIPVRLLATAEGAGPEFHTIGEFYAALDKKLQEMGKDAFIKGHPDREMVDNTWFPPDQLFRITGPESASAAIELIVEQGEGTPTSPLDPEDEPAHYYRFQQIVKGKRLVRDPVTGGFVFGGAPVRIDERNVWNMQPNGDPDTLPKGSRARRASVQFAYAYTSLLNALHRTFNGRPEAIRDAMGLMYQLRLAAQDVLSTPLPDDPGMATGLCFRWRPTTAETST